MSLDTRKLFSLWIESPISRRTLLASMIYAAIAHSSLGRAIGSTPPILNYILGRPTSTSIALSVMTSEDLTVFIEYGYSKAKYVARTPSAPVKANAPAVFEITGLKPNSKVFYRTRFASGSAKTFRSSKEVTFATARLPQTSFTFTVQGDTHPERAGKMFDLDLYNVTMANVARQKPDFHILLGDDFSIDPLISKGQASQANVEKVYRNHRTWLGTVGSSVPIFLINGNHEQAAGYLLDGTTNNPAILAGNARLKYFPLPAPDDFYSGNDQEVPGVGLPRDYYAWTWGDALFVTLDPYWHSPNPVDNVATTPSSGGQGDGSNTNSKSKKGGSGGARDLWKIGIGDQQYSWFKKTLEESSARYKFVFAHHVMGTGRGGIELSYDYEWGGSDPKGATSFAVERPSWELPIHDLMVKNKVTIFFQGHDHIFVTQERDGIIYQSMPNPADDTFSLFNESAYKSGVKAPNSGHVRVSVTKSEAIVEYFLAAREKDVTRKNLQIAHKYSVMPNG